MTERDLANEKSICKAQATKDTALLVVAYKNTFVLTQRGWKRNYSWTADNEGYELPQKSTKINKMTGILVNTDVCLST